MIQQTSYQLILKEGVLVKCHGKEYVVLKIPDLDKVVAKSLETQRVEILQVKDLTHHMADEAKKEIVNVDLLGVSEKDWEYAKNALRIITPLLKRQKRGEKLADKLAAENDVSRMTIFRWLAKYKKTGLLSSLIPEKRSGGRGIGRLNPVIEAIIKEQIDTFYLTDQQPTAAELAYEVRRLCSNAGLPLPHIQTVRNRVKWIEEREHLERRKGKRAAEQRFEANEGSIPNADWPLALVQIDHTKLDIIVVDEHYRMSIGRPWITLAIDVNSRVIPGMYLTLEPPSAMSAGMCLSHAILPKEKWLEERGEKVSWPIWGAMGIVHMDNAREFRGEMLKEACKEYGIDTMLRPVKTPHYGAHIERLMGTFASELKKLPGATFSNIKERGEYDSEKKAMMTLAELEKWLINFIAKYHHRVHAGIGMTPLQKFADGLLGKNGSAPRGLPARRLDVEKVQIDFMPIIERTIQDYGVLIDDIYYFSDVLRPWIGLKEPDNPTVSRFFKFRRDPRDLSLYFFDPSLGRYYQIPFRNISLPPISLAELKSAKAVAKAEGYKAPDETVIFQFANRQREIQDEAALKTKVARKQKQVRSDQAKATKAKTQKMPKTIETAKPAQPPRIPGYNSDAAEAFDDEY